LVFDYPLQVELLKKVAGGAIYREEFSRLNEGTMERETHTIEGLGVAGDCGGIQGQMQE
jgi:hypothetical protein